MNAVSLQILGNALQAIAQEMEAALVRAAYSPNITERRDCSTALFDADGRMIVRPPRSPSTSAPCRRRSTPSASAAPCPVRSGRSTTPTAVGRIFPTSRSCPRSRQGGHIVAYSVSRAHHADVGMSPAACPRGRRSSSRRAWSFPTRIVVGDDQRRRRQPDRGQQPDRASGAGISPRSSPAIGSPTGASARSSNVMDSAPS